MGDHDWGPIADNGPYDSAVGQVDGPVRRLGRSHGPVTVVPGRPARRPARRPGRRPRRRPAWRSTPTGTGGWHTAQAFSGPAHAQNLMDAQ